MSIFPAGVSSELSAYFSAGHVHERGVGALRALGIRFRLALDCADRVFRLLTPPVGERYATIWDLEGGEPLVAEQVAA